MKVGCRHSRMRRICVRVCVEGSKEKKKSINGVQLILASRQRHWRTVSIPDVA